MTKDKYGHWKRNRLGINRLVINRLGIMQSASEVTNNCQFQVALILTQDPTFGYSCFATFHRSLIKLKSLAKSELFVLLVP